MTLRLITSILVWDIIFKTVKKTSNSIIALVLPNTTKRESNFKYSNNYSINNKSTNLELLHLESEINILKAHLNDLNINQSYSNSVQLTVHSINQIIEQMQELMLKIRYECDNHKKKWFSSWRGLDYSEYYHKLIDLHFILDKRMQLLKRIL